ncbi:MAG TPA: hypothetical protein P5556_11215 [Candidatus Gastranaerophilales bacterium]|nr:hypothetical protein [Candidatus Gastranaerophilales bacterium]
MNPLESVFISQIREAQGQVKKEKRNAQIVNTALTVGGTAGVIGGALGIDAALKSPKTSELVKKLTPTEGGRIEKAVNSLAQAAEYVKQKTGLNSAPVKKAVTAVKETVGSVTKTVAGKFGAIDPKVKLVAAGALAMLGGIHAYTAGRIEGKNQVFIDESNKVIDSFSQLTQSVKELSTNKK